MNERDFCYWLNGFVELTQGQTPNPAQWKSIKEHLDLVFKKVTPPVQTGPMPGTPDPIVGKDLQEMLKQYQTNPQWPFQSPLIVTC